MVEDVEGQKNEFISLMRCNIHRDGVDNMIQFLEDSDFFTAPASVKYHGAYEGGLCEHSINVYNNLLKLRDNFYPDYTSPENNETLAVVALLHDVCKIGCYVQTQRNVKAKNPDGSFVYVNGRPQWEEVWGYEWDEALPLGHGEKSCMIIQNHMKLSVEELLAIRWHMGAYDAAFKGGDPGMYKARDMYPLVSLLQTADEMDAVLVNPRE